MKPLSEDEVKQLRYDIRQKCSPGIETLFERLVWELNEIRDRQSSAAFIQGLEDSY